MEPAVILEGTGEELLARADEWKHRQNLSIVDNEPQDDVFTRLAKRGVTWEKGIPVFPPEGDYVSPTIEQVKAWVDDEEYENG